MNRKLRRQMERQGKAESARERNQRNREINAFEKREMVTGLYVMQCLVLHRVFGFGMQRLAKFLHALEDEAGKWTHETLDIEFLHDQLKAETGLDIELQEV